MTLNERVRASMGRDVPGVVVLVVGPEGLRARASVGVADLVTRTPMAAEAAVPWFSMTKIATATATMRLVERGLLELDAPVLPLVPAMRVLRPQEWAQRINVRHLLQHAGGLVNPMPVRWIHPAGEQGPDADGFLADLLRSHPRLRFEPGARSSYSNLGTLVLGAAVANVNDLPFEEVVRREILRPLGMSSTDFAFAEGAPMVTGYHRRASPMRLLLPRWTVGQRSGRWVGFRPFLVNGAAYGGLVGPANDAARFLRMHLCGGHLDGTHLISAEAAREMRTVTLRGRRYDLGLGWLVRSQHRQTNPPFVEHLGGGAGFFNVMRIYPTAGVGTVVMGNSTTYDIDAIAKLALEFQEGSDEEARADASLPVADGSSTSP